MLVLVIGVSVWAGVEASKLHLDHTPRWPPRITPDKPVKLHHARGRYQKLFDAEAGTVVRDGDTYSIVTVKEDAVGVSVGTITARGIPSFEDALSLTSVKLAWRMANELLSFAESADYRYVEERDEAHALAEATRLAWEKYHDHARLLGEHRERHQHSSAATPVEGL